MRKITNNPSTNQAISRETLFLMRGWKVVRPYQYHILTTKQTCNTLPRARKTLLRGDYVSIRDKWPGVGGLWWQIDITVTMLAGSAPNWKPNESYNLSQSHSGRGVAGGTGRKQVTFQLYRCKHQSLFRARLHTCSFCIQYISFCVTCACHSYIIIWHKFGEKLTNIIYMYDELYHIFKVRTKSEGVPRKQQNVNL